MAEKTGAELVEDINKSFLELKAETDKGRKADKEVLAKIEADLARADAENQKRITEAEKKAAAATAKTEALEALMGRIKLGSPAEEKAKTTAERKALQIQYFRTGRFDESKALELKVLQKGDDTAGGYLTSPEFSSDIIKDVVLFSPMRGLVRVRTTSKGSIRLRKRTAVSSAAWVAELETRVESTNPAYGTSELTAHEMTAEHYVSFAELEDADFDIEAELREEFSEQFAVAEGTAIIRGTGVGKPYGIVDTSQAITAKNSGAATAIADANGQCDGIIDTFHDLPSEFAQNARWLLNRKTLGAVRKLKDSQKRYLWEPSPAAGLPSTILGAAYTETPDMDDEGAGKFPMAVGDWRRAYTLLDRVQLAVVRDELTKASVGQVKFVARRRVGGKVVLANAARLLKCST
jgi:HK97 family phage major capsid protein